MIDERSDYGGEWPLSLDTTADGGTGLTAFFCGTLTGLAIGMLLAPARGADTRRRIGSAARRTYRRMRREVRPDAGSTPAAAAFVDRTRTPATGASADAAS